jgi:hypothetical protein
MITPDQFPCRPVLKWEVGCNDWVYFCLALWAQHCHGCKRGVNSLDSDSEYHISTVVADEVFGQNRSNARTEVSSRTLVISRLRDQQACSKGLSCLRQK